MTKKDDNAMPAAKTYINRTKLENREVEAKLELDRETD
jgi:hypothetical protein